VLIWDNLNVHLRAELRDFTGAHHELKILNYFDLKMSSGWVWSWAVWG